MHVESQIGQFLLTVVWFFFETCLQALLGVIIIMIMTAIPFEQRSKPCNSLDFIFSMYTAQYILMSKKTKYKWKPRRCSGNRCFCPLKNNHTPLKIIRKKKSCFPSRKTGKLVSCAWKLLGHPNTDSKKAFCKASTCETGLSSMQQQQQQQEGIDNVRNSIKNRPIEKNAIVKSPNRMYKI